MECRSLPPSLSGLPSTEPSLRNIACPGRHSSTIRHSSSGRRTSSNQHHHHLYGCRHPWSLCLLTCGGYSSRWTRICSMWRASRRLITMVKCSWMRPSIGTPYTSRARTTVFFHGLPSSSSGPQLHGWMMSPIFKLVQDLQGPQETRMELRRMMIWLMCWTTSFEEAELLG